jgi:hypothetical protein
MRDTGNAGDREGGSAMPPATLDGCRVLAYVVVDDSAIFTGRLQLNVGGEWIGRVPRLAICEWDVRPELLLLHCDESWNVLGVQGWNAPGVRQPSTVPEVVAVVERYYQGLQPNWIYVKPT